MKISSCPGVLEINTIFNSKSFVDERTSILYENTDLLVVENTEFVKPGIIGKWKELS